MGLDALIARLAARQHGTVGRWQLLEIGATPGQIRRRIERGLLHPVHRGVYLVGHRAAPPRAMEVAALLATGPGAVLSHRSAAKLWRLLPLDALAGVDVTVPGNRRARAGVRVHRAALTPDETTRRDGLPVTCPARALLDLERTLALGELEQALAEALALRLVRPAQLAGGGPRLRALLAEGPRPTRSEAERRLLALLRRARLPLPATNVRLGRWTVDALWAAQRLVVEVDGYAFHHTRRAWERDRRKDAALEREGYRVLRVTWGELVSEPEAVVARLARPVACR